MDYRELHKHCPSCRVELSEIGHDTGDSDAWFTCGQCAGLWLTQREFFRQYRAAQPRRHVDELLIHNDGSARRPCAVCSELMEIAWLDFLQLDQCEPHGIWFDAGELDRALDNDTGIEQVKRLLKAARSLHKKKAKNAR